MKNKGVPGSGNSVAEAQEEFDEKMSKIKKQLVCGCINFCHCEPPDD